MFTGLIQGMGTLVSKRPAGGGMLFTIDADFEISEPEEGESIACNGVCLTATSFAGRRFTVDVSPESLTRSNLGDKAAGDKLNLERALRLADRLGGHLVSGHVDAVATVASRVAEGDFTRFAFAIPAEISRYIIEKGSITIDGISLTVNQCDETSFSVAIIPHTLQITSLGKLRQGDAVNIEVDLIGKYVEKLLGAGGNPASAPSKLSSSFLAEHGFWK
ncbi:MAG: riboflavin synthase [Thermodesulfobacteriota bacterium]